MLFRHQSLLSAAFTVIRVQARSSSHIEDSLLTSYISESTQCIYDPSNGLNLSFTAVATPWTHVGPCENVKDLDICVYTSTSFAGQHGVSIITSRARAEFIASQPAFVSTQIPDRPHLRSDAPFQTAEIPGKGIGLIATRLIHRGDMLMSETPAVLVDGAASDAEDTGKSLLRHAVENLPRHHREAYLNLSSHLDTSTYESRIQQTLYTNSFDIEIGDNGGGTFYGTFTEISRFNHDCRPNSDFYFDPDTLVHRINANRDIQPGEELSISYIDPTQPREERMEQLERNWGFKCSCRLCTSESMLTEVSDSRLDEIAHLTDRLADEDTVFATSPHAGELLISLYEQEQLRGWLSEAYYYAAIQWNSAREPMKATKFAWLGIEAGLISAGPRDWKVRELKKLVRNPVKHRSWDVQTRGQAVQQG